MAMNPDTGPAAELGGYIDKPEGPITAAILAVGIGCFALGLLTTLAEANEGVKEFLNFYDPVGPLSGKTTWAVAIWLLTWIVLHLVYRRKKTESRKELAVSLVLIAFGLLGTFPIFFQAFAG
ncbi:hypothetical protein L0U85_07820 [Glycomyces sp. L485]|uniref:hypothetical protein n=1 Tax=Glycomyces sp. L485 TaxID=2909235 RepID=UPI001F4A4876|nr:hypothetical protein [Glycomyces sp. L485]MCH7230758.1 hypothetical protein [Glycomyces sp. L485]